MKKALDIVAVVSLLGAICFYNLAVYDGNLTDGDQASIGLLIFASALILRNRV